MSVTLPIDKVKEVLNECVLWKTKTSPSKHQLQSIAGKLNHLLKSIKPARRFTNRLLSAVRASPQFGQHNFNKDILLDLAWFEKFALDYNGVQLLPPTPRQPWIIECDSKLSAAGAFSCSAYYAEKVPEEVLMSRLSIMHLEALNLVYAVSSLLPPAPH